MLGVVLAAQLGFHGAVARGGEADGDAAAVGGVVFALDQATGFQARQAGRQGAAGEVEHVGEGRGGQFVGWAMAAQHQQGLELPVRQVVGAQRLGASRGDAPGGNGQAADDLFLEGIEVRKLGGPELQSIVH